MADDVEVNVPPGTNGMNLRLGNKALGITGPIVIPVLCLAFVAAIGWLRSQDLRDGLAAINAHLQQLYARQDTQRTEMQDLMLTEFKQQREQFRVQTELMHTYQKEFLAHLAEQNTLLHEQTIEVRKQHAILIYNQSHEPAQHLMLDLPIPPAK